MTHSYTLAPLIHICSDRVCQGDIIEKYGTSKRVRRWALMRDDGRGVTPFDSREQALAWAAKRGESVTEAAQ